jgi:fibronectin-binding autotransporter adhesin
LVRVKNWCGGLVGGASFSATLFRGEQGAIYLVEAEMKVRKCDRQALCKKDKTLRGRVPSGSVLLGVAAATTAAAMLLPVHTAAAANTADAVQAGATDLSINTTATYVTAPVGTTTDVEFLNATNYANASSLQLNNGPLSIGTMNDLNAAPITVTGDQLLTLNTGSNSLSGTAGDLFYTASGGSFTINTSGGISFAVSGNVHSVGSLSLGASPVSIANGDTLTFTGAGATSVNGNIANTSGAVTINDSGGSVSFGGSNAYSGATTISAGILQAVATGNNLSGSNSSALSSNSLLGMKTSVLQLRADSNTTFTVANGSGLTGAGTIDVSNVSTGSNNMITLANFTSLLNNTLNVTGGNSDSLVLGALTGSSNGTGTLNVTTANLIATSYTSNSSNNDFVDFTGSGNTTFTGALSAGTAHNLQATFSQTGTVTLDGGNTLSRYSTANAGSSIILNNGTLVLNNATPFDPDSLAPIQLGTATSSTNSVTLFLGSATAGTTTGGVNFVTVAPSRPLTVEDTDSGALTLGGLNTSGTDTFGSAITLGVTANTGKTINLVATTGGTVAFSGGILVNGTGATTPGGINVNSPTYGGTVQLTGTNTYIGATAVNGGTLELGSGGSLAGTAVTVGAASAATLSLGGSFYTIGTGGTTPNGSVALTVNSGAISLANSSASVLTIADSTSGATALTLGGGDTLTFSLTGTTQAATSSINLTGTNAVVSATGTNIVNLLLATRPSTAGTTSVDLINEPNNSGAGGLSASNFSLANANGAGYSFSLSTPISNALVLTETVNAAVTGPLYFGGNIDNTWGDGSTTSSNWSTSQTGFVDAMQAPGSSTDVYFYVAGTNPTNLASSLGNSPFIIRSLTVDGTSDGSTAAVSIASGGATGLLTITPTAGPNMGTGITVNAGGQLTITAPVALGSTQSWSNSGSLTVNGNVTNSTYGLTFTGAGSTSIGGSIGSGAGSLTQSGPGSLTLSGMNTYAGGTNILGGTLSIGATNSLPTTGAVSFGSSTGAGTGTLNLASFSQTAGSLSSQSNNTSGTANVVIIAPGNTLTINGGVSLGIDLSASKSSTSFLTLNGGGALNVATGTANFVVGVAQGSQNYNNQSTLDLTALSSFTFGNSTTGTNALRVGYGQTNCGTLLLSNTANNITAAMVEVGDSASSNATAVPTLVLGAGSNVIAAGTINIAANSSTAGKAYGLVDFASSTGSGSVTITNEAGNGGAVINIGVRGPSGSGTSSSPMGVLNLAGHIANVNAGTVTVGSEYNNGSTGSETGTLDFDTGSFSATTFNVGLDATTGTSTGAGTGALNLGGGVVGATTLNLGVNSNATNATGAATGTLNLTGGSVTIGTVALGTKTAAGNAAANGTINASAGSLTVNSGFTLGSEATAGSSTANLNITGTATVTSNVNIFQGTGSVTGAITLNGGTLDLKGNNIGSSTSSITTLNFQSGTLQNVAQINNGAGLNKTTSGTLILAGSNGYGGGTTVSAGTLYVNNSAGSGTGSGSVSVNGATLAGTGTISGAIGFSSSGSPILQPGAAGTHGILTASSTLTLSNSSTYAAQLNGAAATPVAGTDYSQLSGGTTGAINLNGAMVSVLAVDDVEPAVNSVYQIINYTGSSAASPVSGTFSNMTATDQLGDTYSVSYDSANSSYVDLTVMSDNTSGTPEPASLGLLGLGGVLMMRRRCKTRVTGIGANNNVA